MSTAFKLLAFQHGRGSKLTFIRARVWGEQSQDHKACSSKYLLDQNFGKKTRVEIRRKMPAQFNN